MTRQLLLLSVVCLFTACLLFNGCAATSTGLLFAEPTPTTPDTPIPPAPDLLPVRPTTPAANASGDFFVYDLPKEPSLPDEPVQPRIAYAAIVTSGAFSSLIPNRSTRRRAYRLAKRQRSIFKSRCIPV